MNQKENLKVRRVMEKLKDERSRKVIFVAHCILNENTRWLGGAFRRGCIDEIVDQILALLVIAGCAVYLRRS